MATSSWAGMKSVATSPWPPRRLSPTRALGVRYECRRVLDRTQTHAILDRQRYHLVHVLDGHEAHLTFHVRGHVGEILQVLAREQERLDARAMRGKLLLAPAAARSPAAAECDPSSHGALAASRATGKRREQRGGHRDARRGAILRDRAGRHV